MTILKRYYKATLNVLFTIKNNENQKKSLNNIFLMSNLNFIT